MGTVQDSPIRHRDSWVRPARVGAGVLAAVGMLGGLGTLSAQHDATTVRVTTVATTSPVPPSDQPASAVPRMAPAAATNTAGQLTPQEQQLIGLLPPGYSQSSCQAVTPPAAGAAATVDCYDNSLPGGPSMARYSLFSDQQTLENDFTNNLVSQLNVSSTCPDNGASPGTWHNPSTPNQNGGSVVCATDPGNNNAVVAWTDDSALTMSCAEGPDIAALYKWWESPQPSATNTRVAAS